MLSMTAGSSRVSATPAASGSARASKTPLLRAAGGSTGSTSGSSTLSAATNVPLVTVCQVRRGSCKVARLSVRAGPPHSTVTASGFSAAKALPIWTRATRTDCPSTAGSSILRQGVNCSTNAGISTPFFRTRT